MRLLLSYRCDAFELWMRPRKPLQCWRFHLFMLITCWLFSFRHHTQTPQPSPLAVPIRSGEGRRSPRGGSLGLCFLSDNSQTQSRHSQLLGGSFKVPLLCLVFFKSIYALSLQNGVHIGIISKACAAPRPITSSPHSSFCKLSSNTSWIINDWLPFRIILSLLFIDA